MEKLDSLKRGKAEVSAAGKTAGFKKFNLAAELFEKRNIPVFLQAKDDEQKA